MLALCNVYSNGCIQRLACWLRRLVQSSKCHTRYIAKSFYRNKVLDLRSPFDTHRVSHSQVCMFGSLWLNCLAIRFYNNLWDKQSPMSPIIRPTDDHRVVWIPIPHTSPPHRYIDLHCNKEWEKFFVIVTLQHVIRWLSYCILTYRMCWANNPVKRHDSMTSFALFWLNQCHWHRSGCCNFHVE